MVSRDLVWIALLISEINDLDILAYDIQNANLMAERRERVWVAAETEFVYEARGNMLARKALYGLKSSSKAFRYFLLDNMDEIGYIPSYSDPDL